MLPLISFLVFFVANQSLTDDAKKKQARVAGSLGRRAKRNT